MAYFIFLKYLRSLEEFRKNPCVKIPPKSPCANFQSLGIFKHPIFIQKKSSSDFGPSGPAPPALARFAPQAVGSPLIPFGPSNLGVFAKRCISFDFAHFGKDAFSLSCHCHVGPAYQLHPLPHVGRSHSQCRFSSSPPTTLCRLASNIKIPSKVFTPHLDSPF
jgi:hypothetical protein